jgi:uncharacterized DUF497 family protein
VEFEWNSEKAENNLQKHGVSFHEASTVFGDQLEITVNDPDHSKGEYRFISIGRSVLGRLLVVSYTEIQENQIRIISARQATKPEQRQYEQDN